MFKVKDLTKYLYNHHFVRYLIVGGSTFVIDFGILLFLHDILSLNLAASASFAYWISISYNFILSRHWTFNAREKESLKRHITAYFILLVFNYLFTVTFVSLVGEHINYLLAKAIAVTLQITWTYYIYNHYIFLPAKPTKSSESPDEQ